MKDESSPQPYRSLLILTFALILVSLALQGFAQFFPKTFVGLCQEDGAVEYIGALALLLACPVFLAASFYSRSRIALILLALFCFVSFGEEISWGQRLLGFESPSFFRQWNHQDEFNLHNLAWISGFDEKGKALGGWSNYLNAGRFFTLICFTLGIFLPLARTLSTKVEAKAKELSLASTPLLSSISIGVNYLLFKILILLDGRYVHSRNEVKESVYALCLLYIAIFTFSRMKRKSSSAALRQSLPSPSEDSLMDR